MASGTDLIETTISPDLLETIGKSFRFRHGKGVAEWLKNSLDHYLRLRQQGLEPRSGNWPVCLLLIDGSSTKTGPNLGIVDFGGTSLQKITDFLLNWGSRSAATYGGATSSVGLTGGHGNGGKFYMREMWRDGARFLTFRDGKATSLIVQRRKDGKTGQWEFQDRAMGWREALQIALDPHEGLGGAADIIKQLESSDPELLAELDGGQRGLSVVIGRHAVQVLQSNDVVRGNGRWDPQRLIDEIRDAPQARRPIRELTISVFVNSELRIARLTPEVIPDDPDWPVQEIPFPLNRIDPSADDLKAGGMFRLHKAAAQLAGHMKDRNAVFVTDGRANPIAFYPIKELPLSSRSVTLPFIYGELELTFPEVDDLVQNDRERLVQSPRTESILDWVGGQITERTKAIDQAERELARKTDLQIAAILNDTLNQHAKRFLQELQTEILVDFVDDPEGGGPGAGGRGTGPRGEGPGGTGPRNDGVGGRTDGGGSIEVPGSTERARRPRFPQVLLSDLDQDPANPGSTKHLSPRHSPLEQDDMDKKHNVWWINTSHPFAQEALRRGGSQGQAFKTHQLFMFRDVVQREALRMRQRREAELGLDMVETDLSEVSNIFLAELPRDLIDDLLGAPIEPV